ncbi:hypothetical protein BDR07DRAFT_393680 [Suillus spraguei]|nr:hypothetical protein BDR07DRAFT_393680 [Suillus spraguei]
MEGDDPVNWPYISYILFGNYFLAASSTVVIYDWALTFGQEFDLILSQRWSFMTIFILCTLHRNTICCHQHPIDSSCCNYRCRVSNTSVLTCVLAKMTSTAVLSFVIMIARINAMYEGSKKLLIFLVIILLACTIVSGVTVIIENLNISGQEAVLSGFNTCIIFNQTNLIYENLIPTFVWEILALFLMIWIVIKRFVNCDNHQQDHPLGTVSRC